MKTKIRKFGAGLMAAAVAFTLAGVAFAEDGWIWGVAEFGDGTTKNLTTTNAAGEAVLTDDDLADGTPVEIEFKGTEAIPVGGIVLSGKAITFSGSAPLQADGTNSAFRLTNGDWTFKGLTFKGVGETKKTVYDGGAIDCEGGTLTLADCTFTNLTTRFTGGAVSARLLTGDMLVTNCTFAGNKAYPINGYGGALYASAAADEDVLLDVVDCRFAKNEAENGGAICTLVISSDDEDPVELVIRDGANGTSFGKNRAVYEGGAVFAEGPVRIEGSNTLFKANWAGFGGGAVCLTGIQGDFTPVTLTVTNGVVFADNETSTNVTWTAGGAIAVMPEGCKLEVYRAVFTNNCAKSGPVNGPSFGGAVYTGDGVTNLFWKTAFVDNEASAGNLWCYGGAISVAGGATTVDTCVFDYGTRENATCYGNAIDCNGDRTCLLNSTFRRGKVEAVSAYNGSLAVTNCVAVGNGISADDIDFYVEGDTLFTMAYSAYGAIARADSVNFDGSFNLGGRTVGIYDGESLRLDGSGFNPVAGLGLVQDGVTDFVEVGYGTLAYGYSMGAYETPTTNLVVMVDASKEYDGKVTTNGETEITWSLVSNDWTHATWSDLDSDVQLKFKFTIDAWAYGNSSADPGAAGYYDSTNAQPFKIVATITPVGATNEWLATLLDYRETGTIRPASDVRSYLEPADFAWNGGNPVMPSNGFVRVDGSVTTLVVSNLLTNVELDPSDYEIGWDMNADPTAGTMQGGAYLIVTCTNGNFKGMVLTNAFSITAYRTEYYTNPTDGSTPDNVVTNGALIGSNAVAVISVPTGCCLDYQNSTTNATVYKFGSKEGEPDVTTLKVIYATDVVGTTDPNAGDGVPDKYQKRVIFATVNGNWQGTENGRDIVKWVTLTNTAAKWDASGAYNMTAADGVSVTKFFVRFTEGAWNTDPATATIRGNTFPIFFYKPNSEVSPGRDPGEGGKQTYPPFKLLKAAAPAQSAPSVRISETLVITDFTIGGEHALAGRVVADVVDADSKESLLDEAVPLDNYRIEVLGVSNLGDDWTKVAEATTDPDGFWSVDRLRTSTQGTEQGTTLAARPVRGDEDSQAQAGESMPPAFFKLQLKTE